MVLFTNHRKQHGFINVGYVHRTIKEVAICANTIDVFNVAVPLRRWNCGKGAMFLAMALAQARHRQQMALSALSSEANAHHCF